MAAASNRLQSLSNPSQTLSHDATGNRTGDGTATYGYDARGRLIQAVSAAGTTRYRINALGQRVRKTLVQGGATLSDTLYHYDLAGHLIGESNGAGQAVRDIVWLDDTLVAVLVTDAGGGTKIHHLHTDHLDTPRLVTDEQNTVIWRNQPLAEPFGTSPPEEDPDGNGVPFTLNLRFPGQYFDKETNLHYNYYRDYDPVTGRYIQSDPIGLDGGINKIGVRPRIT